MSAFHTQFLAGAVPSLFAEFGISATGHAADDASTTACTIVVAENPAQMTTENGETLVIRTATVRVRRSEFVPTIGSAFTVSTNALTGTAQQWVVIHAPVTEAGVAICECEMVTQRNVNPLRTR